MIAGKGVCRLFPLLRARIGVRAFKTTPLRSSKIGPNDIVPHAKDPHYILYRSPYPPPRRIELIGAEVAYAMLWFWIFFRFIQDYRMVFTNEWQMPTWSDFTDEELGIPAITEDEIQEAL